MVIKAPSAEPSAVSSEAGAEATMGEAAAAAAAPASESTAAIKAPAVGKEEDKEGEAEAEAEAEPAAEISLEVELPTGVVLQLPPMHKGEVGLGLRQVLGEYPEACFYTSYALVVKDSEPRVEINDFVDLSEYEGVLVDGSRLLMVLEDYDKQKQKQKQRKQKRMPP
eukprot:evm.model.NODE_39607_length_6196_cov_17.542286.2